MKYFRTKENNIYKRLFNDGAIIGANMGSSCCDKNLNPIGETIIKESDNLKELCDEFVVIGYKIKDPFIFSKEGISIDDFWKNSPSDTIVYGAIWTNKGLIYVAKMNEKGEMELL